jgi:hypothetical protein
MTVGDPFIGMSIRKHRDASVVSDYGIKAQELEQVFFLPTPYNDAFQKHLDMKRIYPTTLPSGGMHFITSADHLILQHIAKGSPCAKIQDWHTRIKGHGLFRSMAHWS